MSTAPPSPLLNLLIRMVVPMKREFGHSLDVQLFLRDDDYARSMLEQALAAQDTRLRDYAAQVNQHLGGPRRAADAPLKASLAALPAAATAASADAAPEEGEAEMRARMMRKYTSGLR